MTLKPTLRQCIVLIVTVPLITVGVLYAAYQSVAPPPAPLSAFVPQGSLLSIEAADFAALLSSWSSSSEQRRWLTSDNYAAFSRSRLFARLGEAQDQFATSAGLPPDMKFLQQIAGRQSIFAWYDIGNLQFLYITQMPSTAAEQTQLVQLRSKFQLRKAGDDSFYVRTQGDPERTVAFAVHGDYLLLATREDLLANALLLLQHQGDASLENESWYITSTSAAKSPAVPEPPALRMTLNLARILPSPYFRSYWIQQNITELKQFSSAVSDLYLGQQSFREERVLIPTTTENPLPTSDLAPLLQLLPSNAGVYRATAQPTTEQIADALNDKILSRSPSSFRDQHLAPVADLSVQNAGSPTDLDTRIDTLLIPQQPLTASLASIRAVLDSAHPNAMLVYSATTNSTKPDTIFLPIHNVVILSAPAPWTPDAVQSALTEALSSHLTIGSLGLTWRSRQQGSATLFQLSGLQSFAFAIQGNRFILATDSESLIQFLGASDAAPKPIIASTIAGFHHTAEGKNFERLTSLFDHTVSTPPSDDVAPAFFSRNVASLSTTFESLDSETFTEAPVPSTDQQPNTIHQTVFYQWRPESR
jgi:hypothetical protein